jgi:hypothetical protein
VTTATKTRHLPAAPTARQRIEAVTSRLTGSDQITSHDAEIILSHLLGSLRALSDSLDTETGHLLARKAEEALAYTEQHRQERAR